MAKIMTNVVMPQMGESIAEGTIVRWIKKVGDTVDRDEPLFEISTDKVDAEIPSPAAGVLTEIKVKEGETVPVNSVVAVIGAAARRAAPAPPRDTLPEAAAGQPRQPKLLAGQLPTRPAEAPTKRRRLRGGDARRGRPATAEVLSAGSAHRPGAPRRHRQIHGTGISGRVTKQDILDYIDGRCSDAAGGSAGVAGAGRCRRRRPPRRSDLQARRARQRSCR